MPITQDGQMTATSLHLERLELPETCIVVGQNEASRKVLAKIAKCESTRQHPDISDSPQLPVIKDGNMYRHHNDEGFDNWLEFMLMVGGRL